MKKNIILILMLLIPFIILLSGCKSIGKLPSGERLERIEKSPNYIDGAFRNKGYEPGPNKRGINIFSAFKKHFLEKRERSRPSSVLPSEKTDLRSFPPDEDVLVWLGHSSYFMQIDGKKILVDPVLSGKAMVLSSYEGSDVYTYDDIPEIDYMIITHDHWDHLDYKTVTRIKNRVGKVLTGLGTGAHLEYWGYSADKVIEHDWDETTILEDGFSVTALRTRHFSGRFLTRNSSLWAAFAFFTPTKKIYIGGDTGYGDHFNETGERYGPFDLVILDSGQYNEQWSRSHMFPEQTVQAAFDLNAEKLFGGHWGKFTLSIHTWDDPIIRLYAESLKRGMPLIHPLIGERVDLNSTRQFSRWWESVDIEEARKVSKNE
jgi:L-ascorbate metabolism protein UlaG (beta-lactamase superfamily)